MAKKRISNYKFYPGVARNSNAYPNAYSLIQANKTFIIKESSAFIAEQVVLDSAQNLYPNAVTLLVNNKQFILDEISAWITDQVATASIGTTFYGYSYGVTEKAKCKRDMGYLIDALIYDIKYGGNEKVSYIASQYYQGGVIQLINVAVEVAVQNQLWSLIKNYILPKISYTSQQSPVTTLQNLNGQTAETGSITRATTLSPIAKNVISGGLSTLPATEYSIYSFAEYGYDASKCERDIGYVLDAYLHDLRYGGNEQTRMISSKYWEDEVPQILGSRNTEIVTHQFIENLINNVLLRGEYSTKCERDVGYMLDGVQYDVALGTNYNAVFLGLAEYNSLDIDDFVISTIQATKTEVAALPEVAANATALSRSNTFFSEIIDIATNGRSAANIVTFTNPTTASASQIAAKDKLIANKIFLAAEVNAWVASTYPGANHDSAKCLRDINYAIDAICYDVLYGGNQATYNQAKFFFYGFADGTSGIDPSHKAVTIAAYNYLKSIINEVVSGVSITKTTTGQQPNIYQQITSGNNAEPQEATICENLVQITASVINAGSQQVALEYLSTVTKTYPEVLWAATGIQSAKTAIQSSIDDIISSVVYTPYQELYPRQLLNRIVGESNSSARITALVSLITDVIANGLSSLPDIEYGVTTVKIQGKYDLDKLLLITNVTNNQILYNFSDPALTASVSFFSSYNSNRTYKDEQYPLFLQTADYVTTIELDSDTSNCSPTDDVQIFVEGEEQKVRPYDFGTDAIERMRVAQPQSMLDADFEYGLQPTKWQAIGIARGYPSVYEIPGSDTAVLSVITDASTGTGGIGESLITVTTQSAHGWSVGTPITIKSLANTISGFNRAEGTFIIVGVPTPTSFTYYATAKVGSQAGQVLATTYTQLRKASFYTGASIGNPTLSIYSNGQVGSFTTKFATPAGSPLIAVSGSLPVLGVPLSATGVATGTQVSGTVGSGGQTVSAGIQQSIEIGDSSIVVDDTTGILEGMAVDNGSGTAIFVSNIQEGTVFFNGLFTSEIGGSSETYLNVSGENIAPPGFGATFDVSRVSGAYASVDIATGGTGYELNTRFKFLGSELEGEDVTNDLLIKVSEVKDGQVGSISHTGAGVYSGKIISINATGIAPLGGLITAISSAGVAVTPFNPYTAVTQSSTTGSGSGITVNITDPGDGGYLVELVSAGKNYQVGDLITILGSVLGGVDGVNDLTISVNAISLDVASNVVQSTTSGAGTGATFDVSLDNNGAFIVTLQDVGQGYAVSDTITIFGSLVGGEDTTNDLTITITDATLALLGANINPSATSGAGIQATFSVSLDNLGGYLVSISNKGQNYQVSDTITIFGSLLGGVNGINDLIITVEEAIDGIITGVSILYGNSVTGERSYTNVLQSTTTGTGADASFGVQTSSGSYEVTLLQPGQNYVLDEELTVLGSVLGGVDGVNDLTITITSSSGVGGGILTFNTSGIPSTTDKTFTDIAGTKATPGVASSFDITRAEGTYTNAVVNIGGAGYAVNDKIKILGSNVGGSDTTNDVVLTVTNVNVENGSIITVTAEGTSVGGGTIQFWSAVALTDVTTAAIANGTSISTLAVATVQVTWPTPHGLVPGMSILADITSTGTNHSYAKGPFFVEQTPTAYSIRYTARTTGALDTGTALTGIIYARPQSFFVHRPYDGGVQLGTGGPQHGSQAIRMSKKYIRYQSGKGVMYTTGALFAPSYNLQSATASGTAIGSYIQFTTDDVDHGCQVGGKVRIVGVDTAGYNGEYTIVSVQTERVFTVQATTTLGNTTAQITANAQMSILNWHGATVRAGTYDEQNGMFWQYDGQQLSVVRRSSTFQLAGVVSIPKDTNLLTGANTRFRDQLHAGDKIVIKGMTHTVTTVISQTQLAVTPDYRGAKDCVNSKACLVQDLIIPQNEFNLDKLDGTGPSGYNLDITKMQMIGMQWSWYGAGFIDFMLRGSDGNYVFCHRIRNSNVNTEAYMRTGNMPVRYEVVNESATGRLRKSISATATEIPLDDASMFPNESGYIYIDNEIISFTGKNRNNLVGCTRGVSMIQFSGGSQRAFSAGAAATHEVNTGVILISNTITPIISHWGSAFLTDGQFDEDRGYIFNYVSTGIQASTTKQTAFLIRLAPSVSNAQVGDLGDKELINRAQILLQGIEVTSDTGTGGLVVEGILNPQNYPVDPTAITWSALNSSAAGGQPSFAQVAPGGSVSWSGGATTTLAPATTTSALTGSATVPNSALFASAAGSNILYVTKSSWDSLGATIGFSVDSTETRYPSGTTITNVTANPSPTATTLGLITGNATIPPSTYFKLPSGTNYLYFTQASWTALNGAIGVAVSSTDFPAGTTVTNVTGPAVAAGQSYYTVTFSNGSTVAHNPVQSILNTTFLNINNNVATVYFATQSYPPYLVGETITLATSYSLVNGNRTVTACATNYVQFTTSGLNNVNGGISGNVRNTTSLDTTSFSVTGQATVGTTSLNFTQSSWVSLPIGTPVVGQLVNDVAKFANGTTITNVSALKTFSGVNYYTVTFSNGLAESQPAGTQVTFDYTPYYAITLSKNATSSINYGSSVGFTPAIIATNTSFLYFTRATWESLTSSYGAGAGTLVVDPDKFPSGTTIQSFSALLTFGGTQYYRVNFTQSSITEIPPGTEITFQFGQPPYALPGETVFSFISTPGGSNSLDLSTLKELTNTTLGGRGTYPNGPDVLAINVYKTSGTAIPTNLILRWGEAQA